MILLFLLLLDDSFICFCSVNSFFKFSIYLIISFEFFLYSLIKLFRILLISLILFTKLSLSFISLIIFSSLSTISTNILSSIKVILLFKPLIIFYIIYICFIRLNLCHYLPFNYQ